MKKTLILLAAVVLLTSTSGCGLGRRLRDRMCRGAYCGTTTVPAVTTAVPAPAPTPILVPQTAAPVQMYPQYGVPCQSCYPCDPCCQPCNPCGDTTHYDSGWNAASDCGCNAGGYLPTSDVTPTETIGPYTTPANTDPAPQ